MQPWTSPCVGWAVFATAAILTAAFETVTANEPNRAKEAVHKATSVNLKDHRAVAREIDRLIAHELATNKTDAAPRAADEDFIRRVTLDIAGTIPTPADVDRYVASSDDDKRAREIDRLLQTDDYARNWARYWRDVIFYRATEMRARIAVGSFEQWMTEQLRRNVKWDQIATSLLTATGDVLEEGDTALIFAQSGQAPEIAAEASRVFLGIQIQCAECHDHPTDKWKREQFHQLAAFFPRIAVRPRRDQMPYSFEVASYEPGTGRDMLRENPELIFRRLDRNRDQKITKEEAESAPRLGRIFDRILENGDTNKDNAVTIKEIRNMPMPDNQRRGSDEHYMPDLSDPSSKGKKTDPVFFVNGKRPKSGLSDADRREALAGYLTSPGNPWFARAYVNRIWCEMLGRGFYMPVDDIGPERSAVYPEVLELLAKGFVASKYDPRWLMRTIANTEAYQRAIRDNPDGDETAPFAAALPTRLRSDQVFNAITRVLGIEEPADSENSGQVMRPRMRNRSPRGQFNTLFGYDPSTPQQDLAGNVPQALFLMNSRVVNGMVMDRRGSTLGEILDKSTDDKDAISDLYMLTLSRKPSETELQICLKHVGEGAGRREGFEDVLWSLLNSSEFLTKR